MLDIYFYVNTILFIVVGVVMLIGNVTYANYYTRIDEDTVDTFWKAYVAIAVIGFINLLLTTTAKLLIGSDSINPVLYASGWISVLLTVIYLSFICYAIVLGFCKLKRYFGNKRNKI